MKSVCLNLTQERIIEKNLNFFRCFALLLFGGVWDGWYSGNDGKEMPIQQVQSIEG